MTSSGNIVTSTFLSEFVNGQPESYYHGEGRVALTGDKPAFQYKLTDHLGNTMVLFEDINGDGITAASLSSPKMKNTRLAGVSDAMRINCKSQTCERKAPRPSDVEGCERSEQTATIGAGRTKRAPQRSGPQGRPQKEKQGSPNPAGRESLPREC